VLHKQIPDRTAARRQRPANSGFTLMEMMIVIAIIGVLAVLVGPSVFRNLGVANMTAARSQVETLAVALESFRMDTGRYPTTEEGLAVLRVIPAGTQPPAGWQGPYLRKSVPPDPWKRQYVYRSPGEQNPESYDLLTYGRDGLEGGNGENADVTSWGENNRE
jgi:general secretion pathway protein G